MTPKRVVCHFSCGTSSAVATKLALDTWRGKTEVVIYRIAIKNEHEDSDRFAQECAQWFRHPITNISSSKYADIYDVFEKERYIAGIHGAKCTTELKKLVARSMWRDGDLDVLGYHAGERKRFEDFKRNNIELTACAPLIEAGITKKQCHRMVAHEGIVLPMMYRMGYHNNNCIGCVKGGAGYWNKIRVDFPEVFAKTAELSRRMNVRLVKIRKKRIFLDELPPNAGRYKNEPDIECGLFCNPV